MFAINTAIQQATQLLKNTSDSAALDAEVLLCFVLQKNRSYLRTWPEKPLNATQLDDFQSLLKQRFSGTPIAYLTGIREFWSREFKITPDVLIPRPETELLIELTLALIPENKPLQLIDLGTGSGAIAITLAAECPAIKIIASDISMAALHIAQQNAKHHQTHNIQFQHSDWFAQVTETTFDIVVSNPPYIADKDPHLQQGDVRFEPDSALIAQQQGLKDIAIITAASYSRLKPNGYLLLEHGYQQQHAVQSLFKHHNYRNISTYVDLSGLPRVTSGQR